MHDQDVNFKLTLCRDIKDAELSQVRAASDQSTYYLVRNEFKRTFVKNDISFHIFVNIVPSKIFCRILNEHVI